jgi:hypothetical protein
MRLDVRRQFSFDDRSLCNSRAAATDAMSGGQPEEESDGTDCTAQRADSRPTLVDNRTGRRVGRLKIRSMNGQILKASDMVVRKKLT